MVAIPIETEDHKNDAVILFLDETAIARMREADPAELVLRQTKAKLVNPSILVCLEKVTPEFQQIIHSGNLGRILDFAMRGFKFRPELGDHDRGLESLKGTN